MPTFRGVDHVSLSVSDLDASERFYTDVLDFMVVLDFGHGRVCIHRRTGFVLGLIRHPGGSGSRFSETNTGLDHLGLVAAGREELEAWEERFLAAGVTFTPIRDMELGHHLNFRDPDGIALELYAPNARMAAALHKLRTRDVSRDEVLAMAEQLAGTTHVARGR